MLAKNSPKVNAEPNLVTCGMTRIHPPAFTSREMQGHHHQTRGSGLMLTLERQGVLEASDRSPGFGQALRYYSSPGEATLRPHWTVALLS